MSMITENVAQIRSRIAAAARAAGRDPADIRLCAATKMNDSAAAKRGIGQDILLEVNAGGEKQKSGFLLKEFPRIVEEMADYPAVRVRGLMTVPPIGRKKGDNCRYFQKIRRIAVDITAQKYDNIFMDFLSMGMTDDFEDAIACGSTMVRIGTAIFGPRNYAQAKSD